MEEEKLVWVLGKVCRRGKRDKYYGGLSKYLLLHADGEKVIRNVQ